MHWQTAKIEDCFKSFIFRNTLNRGGEGTELFRKTVSGILLFLLLVSMLTAAFNIKPAKAEGETIYIRADGSIDPPTAPIQRDGDVYTFTDNINDSIVVEKDNIVIDGAGYTVEGTGGGKGIDLTGRSKVTIKNMTIKNFQYGIYLWYSSNYNSIVGNTITENSYMGIHLRYHSNDNNISGNNITANHNVGIWLYYSSNYNSIIGNNLTNNDEGIRLIESSNNSIAGNNIANGGSGAGIFIDESNYNIVSGNNIANHYYGINLFYSSNNSITGNTITENHNVGIRFWYSSNYNSIVGNTITENNDEGIYLYESSYNKFYHNNFIDNTQQVFCYGYHNVWDDGYPSGGNYWSDYTDVDLYSGLYQNETGSDGVWDHPYVIDANNKDQYPLVNPWVMLTDDFSTDSGMWSFVESVVNIDTGVKYPGSAYRDPANEYMVLTENRDYQAGVIWLNHDIFSPFTIEFKYKAGGGTGADGLVFIFYKQKNYDPYDGGGLGFVTPPGGPNMPTEVPGYGIEFDNWQNEAYNDPSGNHIALIKDHVNNHVKYANDSRTEDNQWHNVKIIVGGSSIEVYLDDGTALTWQGTIDRTYGGLGFSATTASHNNWHIIDDIKITLNPWTPTPPVQEWLFDGDFQYNLDDNYGTVEGTGHLSGTATLSSGILSIGGQITITGPLPVTVPEVYLIATDGPDKELAKQAVDLSGFGYWQTGTNTYNFTGQIPNVIQPINNGHYEAQALITYNTAKYEFFINTASLTNSHYFPLTTPPTPLPNQRPNKPSNVFPEDGATNINLVITLKASPFSDPDHEDTCTNAQWQITTVPSDYSNPVFNEVGYTYYFNTIILPTGTLDYSTTYYWRMRYQDNHGAWSDWSDETSFTTAALSFDYSPINPFVGEQVTFTVSNCPPGAISEWDFGDGSPVLREEAWRGATHTYENAGLYTVTLILTDQNGKQSFTSQKLEISNDELIASLKVSNYQPKMGEEIVLDASGSHNLNPRVRITSYKWEFFDSKGARIKEGSTNSPIIFYYWKNKGEYSVRLTVENENGLTAVTSATIRVQEKHFWEDWFKDRPEIDEQRLDNIISSLGLNFGDKKELAAILYKPVANKEILTGGIENKEDAVAYTYGAKVALTLGEMEMVQDVLTWQANIDLTQRVDAYLPYIATLEAVKQIAMIIVDGGLEGLKWIGVVISGGKEAWDVGWGVADIERTIPTLGIWKTAEYYNALRWYLELRSEGLNHSEAWNSDEVVYSLTIYTQEERNALEPSFMRFGDIYAQYVTNYGLQEDFMNQVKEGLRTELLCALEQYKFEPLYEQVKIKSAGELRVYDSLNRVTGLVNGQIRQEIPLSFYDKENETVVIFDPSDTYLYEVVGTDEGTYGLEITSVEYVNTTTFIATDIPTSSGATHNYTIDWDALSRGEGSVTVQVDSDGDGVFEHIFTSDGQLTHDEFVLQTETTIDFDPDALNLKSKGKWVTAYIEFPEGYNVSDIDVSSILLNGTIPVDMNAPTAIGDYDGDGVPDLMVKFNRTAVCEFILSKGIKLGNVTLTVSGKLRDGTEFEGCDTIRVRMPGDLNMDGKVDMKDIVLAARAFGEFPGRPRWNPMADENEDGIVDLRDIALIARNFGKTYE
jgi:parallel beta-helix repeat protein